MRVGGLRAIAQWSPSVVPLGPSLGARRLVFRDEFDGPAISEANYRSYYGVTAATNATLASSFTANMTTNTGYAAGIGGNQDGGPVSTESFIRGGNLIVQAEKTACTFGGAAYPWSRGLVRTARDFLYCVVEARIYLPPAGPGAWPAFWGWPNAPDDLAVFGEIDIFERLNNDALVYQNVHKWSGGSDVFQTGPTPTSATFPSFNPVGYHVYTCEWTASAVNMWIDGTQTVNYTGANIPNQPLCWHLDHQIGGIGSWPGATDGTTPTPMQMQVDYLRVWQ